MLNFGTDVFYFGTEVFYFGTVVFYFSIKGSDGSVAKLEPKPVEQNLLCRAGAWLATAHWPNLPLPLTTVQLVSLL